MSPDKTEELFRRFPRLYAERHLPESKSRMCDGFMCGDGWFEILLKLSAKLEHASSKPVAFQVKEKFGELRFHLRDEEGDDEDEREPTESDRIISEALEEAERLSRKTCELCGSPGVLRAFVRNESSGAWSQTLCADHTAERIREDGGTARRVSIIEGCDENARIVDTNATVREIVTRLREGKSAEKAAAALDVSVEDIESALDLWTEIHPEESKPSQSVSRGSLEVLGSAGEAGDGRTPEGHDPKDCPFCDTDERGEG